MLLEGIFLTLTTPFHADGRVFLRKLETNVGRYSLTPAAGMLVLGREGEGDGLTDAEAREVLRTAIGAAADDKVMLANVGRESVRATLELAGFAADAGYDAVVVRGPVFAEDAAMRAEVLTYFRVVADEAALPVVLASEPGRELSAEMVGELAGHAGVIGILDASGERVGELRERTAGVSREVVVTNVFAAATGRMLRRGGEENFVSAASLGGVAVATPAVPRMKTRTKRVGFQVLAGANGGMLEAWSAGASGAVPRLAACAPQACCEVWQAFRDGDPALAAEKQDRVRMAARQVEGWDGVAALKYGCDLNGYFGGAARLPLLALTGESREAMERVLGGLKN